MTNPPFLDSQVLSKLTGAASRSWRPRWRGRLIVALWLGLAGLAHAQAPGTLDPGFQPGTFLDGVAFVQPDDKVLYNDLANAPHVVRLNADGTPDPGFSVAPSVDEVTALEPSGKLLATDHQDHLVQLKPDGSVDSTFDAGQHAGTIVLQPNGKILVSWTTSDLINHSTDYVIIDTNLIRLNADGTLDTSFTASFSVTQGPTYFGVHFVLLQSDGKIMVIGDFTGVDGVATDGIVRLNADGSLDPSFHYSKDASHLNFISQATIQPDDKVVVGWSNGFAVPTYEVGVARLNTDGSLDDSFSFDDQFSNSTQSLGGVSGLLLQPDGKIITGLEFDDHAGRSFTDVVRLNADGSVDPGFPLLYNLTPVLLESDGKLFVFDHDQTQTYRVYAYTPDFSGLPAVTLSATAPRVTAGSGETGVFTLNLSAAQDQDVYVNLLINGSAVNGADYSRIKTPVRIKAGKTSKTLQVIPQGAGAGPGGERTVALKLAPGEGVYTTGTAGKVKVKIAGQ